MRHARKEEEQPTRNSPVPTPVLTGSGCRGRSREPLSRGAAPPDDRSHYEKAATVAQRLEFDEIGLHALFHGHGNHQFQDAARPSSVPRRPFVLAAGTAWAQSAEIKFKHSSLVIVTGAREIKFDVELALNDAERARGLMFREKLGPYDGMLFDFYQEAPVSFWMKNTLIPLDMVFIAGDGTIRHIHANAVPLSTDTIPSGFPVRAVLEINGGSAKLLGIKPATRSSIRSSATR